MLKSENKLKEYFYIIPLLFLVLYHFFLSNNQNISLLQKVIILSVMILLSLFILNKKIPLKTHFKSTIIITALSIMVILIAIFTYKIVALYYA